MIIDCHGHYTTAPRELEAYRQSQIAGLGDPSHVPAKGTLNISDDQIRESVEKAQLRLQRERGTDLSIDPETGHYFHDLKRYIDAIPSWRDEGRRKIFEGNARRVYSRLTSRPSR